LFVIDVQESFRQRPIWAASSNPGIAKRVQQLTEAFRDKGDLVV
jgi:nicotinamidase-related amidase